GVACLAKFRDTKVEDFNAISAEAVWFQPDVVGFQITMDHALQMGFVDRGTILFENVDYPVKRKPRLFGQDVAEGAAVKILHHQIGNALLTSTRKTKVG